MRRGGNIQIDEGREALLDRGAYPAIRELLRQLVFTPGSETIRLNKERLDFAAGQSHEPTARPISLLWIACSRGPAEQISAPQWRVRNTFSRLPCEEALGLAPNGKGLGDKYVQGLALVETCARPKPVSPFKGGVAQLSHRSTFLIFGKSTPQLRAYGAAPGSWKTEAYLVFQSSLPWSKGSRPQ
jgi:hypothetical protein